MTTRKFVLTSWCLGRQDGNNDTDDNDNRDNNDNDEGYHVDDLLESEPESENDRVRFVHCRSLQLDMNIMIMMLMLDMDMMIRVIKMNYNQQNTRRALNMKGVFFNCLKSNGQKLLGNKMGLFFSSSILRFPVYFLYFTTKSDKILLKISPCFTDS